VWGITTVSSIALEMSAMVGPTQYRPAADRESVGNKRDEQTPKAEPEN
jgi:hypothetical protein